MSSVGVVVFTLRGLQQIDRCIESVGWADTVDLCELDEGPLCQPLQRDTTDWVLYIWGGECVDAELSRAIRDAVGSVSAAAATEYRVRVRSRLLNHWLEASCWGPAPSPRLLRGGLDEPLFGWKPASFNARGVPVLPGWVSDYSLEELSNAVDQLNACSSIWARDFTDLPRGPVDLIRPPVRVLVRLLFRDRLCLRGLPGVGLSVIASYGCLASLMKAWEMRFASESEPPAAHS